MYCFILLLDYAVNKLNVYKIKVLFYKNVF